MRFSCKIHSFSSTNSVHGAGSAILTPCANPQQVVIKIVVFSLEFHLKFFLRPTAQIFPCLSGFYFACTNFIWMFRFFRVVHIFKRGKFSIFLGFFTSKFNFLLVQIFLRGLVKSTDFLFRSVDHLRLTVLSFQLFFLS